MYKFVLDYSFIFVNVLYIQLIRNTTETKNNNVLTHINRYSEHFTHVSALIQLISAILLELLPFLNSSVLVL